MEEGDGKGTSKPADVFRKELERIEKMWYSRGKLGGRKVHS